MCNSGTKENGHERHPDHDLLRVTYSPDDNKQRVYSAQRLGRDTYERVSAAGFRWAPKRELFVAPTWTTQRG